ncbi:hypothetical protein HYV81_04495 [Candidatus Woesearchaeota archaeon]|nr:hypothetical protein [Candidatus Woesearchaeota archaeon]
MDVAAHALWTFVIVYLLSQWKPTAGYFNTKKKIATAVIAGFGIDLLFAPQFFYMLTHFPARSDFYQIAPHFPQWMFTWYYINHNYFFIALIAVILYFTYREYTAPATFALALHITMDIFTHKNVFELKPFWPLQQVPFPGLVSWGQPTFFKWNWIILLFSFALVFFHMQYQKRKLLGKQIKAKRKKDK